MPKKKRRRVQKEGLEEVLVESILTFISPCCACTHTHTHGARNHGPLTYVSRSLCAYFCHSTYPRATAWSSLGTHHPQVWQSRNWKWVCAVNNLHSRNYSLSHLLYPVTCYFCSDPAPQTPTLPRTGPLSTVVCTISLTHFGGPQCDTQHFYEVDAPHVCLCIFYNQGFCLHVLWVLL